MNRVTRSCGVMIAATALGLVGAGRSASAQVAAPAPPQSIRLNENTFNQWALGPGATAESIHEKLESRLSLRIDQIHQVCGLTDSQKKRLRLAGQGDIKRLHNRFDEKKRTIVDVPVDRAKLNDILRDLQPLRFALQSDPFGDGSIFSKVLRSTLDPEQFARYEKDEAERKQFRHQASIDLTVAMFDRVASLGADQRRRFAELLRDSTSPPRKSGPYDYYVLLFQLDDVPAETLKPIFEEGQLNSLRTQIQRARALETSLRAGGYLPDAPPAGKPVMLKD